MAYRHGQIQIIVALRLNEGARRVLVNKAGRYGRGYRGWRGPEAVWWVGIWYPPLKLKRGEISRGRGGETVVMFPVEAFRIWKCLDALLPYFGLAG